MYSCTHSAHTLGSHTGFRSQHPQQTSKMKAPSKDRFSNGFPSFLLLFFFFIIIKLTLRSSQIWRRIRKIEIWKSSVVRPQRLPAGGMEGQPPELRQEQEEPDGEEAHKPKVGESAWLAVVISLVLPCLDTKLHSIHDICTTFPFPKLYACPPTTQPWQQDENPGKHLCLCCSCCRQTGSRGCFRRKFSSTDFSLYMDLPQCHYGVCCHPPDILE